MNEGESLWVCTFHLMLLIFNSCLSELPLRPIPPARSYVGIMMDYQCTPWYLPLKPRGGLGHWHAYSQRVSAGVNFLKLKLNLITIKLSIIFDVLIAIRCPSWTAYTSTSSAESLTYMTDFWKVVVNCRDCISNHNSSLLCLFDKYTMCLGQNAHDKLAQKPQ